MAEYNPHVELFPVDRETDEVVMPWTHRTLGVVGSQHNPNEIYIRALVSSNEAKRRYKLAIGVGSQPLSNVGFVPYEKLDKLHYVGSAQNAWYQPAIHVFLVEDLGDEYIYQRQQVVKKKLLESLPISYEPKAYKELFPDEDSYWVERIVLDLKNQGVVCIEPREDESCKHLGGHIVVKGDK